MSREDSKLNIYRGNPKDIDYDPTHRVNPYLPKGYKERLSIGNHQELVFTIGLPASGKTTWAREFCIDNPNFIRVNRDDLRNMRGEYWIPKQEDMITKWEVMATALALSEGKSVILDATNLHEARRKEFVIKVNQALTEMGSISKIPFIVNMKKFDTPVEECVIRDEKRTVGKVGKKVILQFANKYGLQTKYPEYRFQAGLPQAIICDLDGTLANNTTGRGFYEWKAVGDDDIDPIINNILDYHREHGVKIILMSGRDSICRPETVQWAKDNEVLYDELFMRGVKDQRKDSIVKRELYENLVKDKYNVIFALDDRDQVVDMWRKELGIKVLQVNYGDF